MSIDIEKFVSTKNWAIENALQVLKKIDYKIPKKGFVLFCTGYGPSGLPHIGTFGEVARTVFVQHAFKLLTPEIPTKLVVISDDMDGLRKVPDNVPNKDMMKQNLGRALTSIPDPFGSHKSYAHNANSRLLAFLDSFNFEYEFLSATDAYKNGLFNYGLQRCAEKYEELMNIMLPTLGEERRATYSPFMPIDQETGIVLSEGVIKINPKNQTIIYKYQNKEKEISYLNGNCKLQWKCDFGMRWFALDVDYESYGKDHLPNEPVYRSICQTLGNEPPVNYFFELFLDEDGKKISKSKGNGLTIETWLKYANTESLAYYMFLKPQTAKKLYFDVIPKAVDEYLTYLKKYNHEKDEENYQNPVFYVHKGKPPRYESKINYSLLLNIASACSPDNEDILWDFLIRYDDKISKNDIVLSKLVNKSINYYNDFVKTKKKYLKPDGILKEAVIKFKTELESKKYNTEEEIQNLAYAIGNEYKFDLKEWFSNLYQIMIGLSTGPRIGSFIYIYGNINSIKLLNENLK